MLLVYMLYMYAKYVWVPPSLECLRRLQPYICRQCVYRCLGIFLSSSCSMSFFL